MIINGVYHNRVNCMLRVQVRKSCDTRSLDLAVGSPVRYCWIWGASRHTHKSGFTFSPRVTVCSIKITSHVVNISNTPLFHSQTVNCLLTLSTTLLKVQLSDDANFVVTNDTGVCRMKTSNDPNYDKVGTKATVGVSFQYKVESIFLKTLDLNHNFAKAGGGGGGGGRLNIKMFSYQYRHPSVENKTVSRPSYL